MQLSNITGIPLPFAVWLAADGYDFQRGTRRAISATSLLKPVRKYLLAERMLADEKDQIDVSDLIASRLGHTIHDGIEKAWTHDYKSSMRKLGYPEKVIEAIMVNPEGPVPEGAIPVYLEQRTEREIAGYVITGKFDMILNGELQDFKSTSVYSMIYGGKDEDYKIQGSVYRWLNQDKVTSDELVINFVFTDWSKAEAKRNPNYPQQRLMPHRIQMMSIPETEAWIRAKIKAFEAAADLPESEMPFCTDEELWRGEDKWKYYSDPAKANDPSARSTKNFDNEREANAFLAEKGGKGIVVKVPGLVKACGYCPAFNICTQKDLYEHG